MAARHGEVTLPWPDEDRTYRLGLKEIRELQTLCGNRGPERILNDLGSGEWLVDDLYQIVRLGLLGGGLDAARAVFIAERYVIGRPLYEAKVPCQAILLACLVKVPGDAIDERPPDGQAGEKTTEAAGSGSPSSSVREPPSSDGLPSKPSSTAPGNSAPQSPAGDV